MTDGRPQDQGRRHRGRAAPSAASRSLLDTYRAAMRDELSSTLEEIRGQVPASGLFPDAPAIRVRPPLGDRLRLWDLAIKLGRELGAEVDVAPAVPASAPARARRAPRAEL